MRYAVGITLTNIKELCIRGWVYGKNESTYILETQLLENKLKISIKFFFFNMSVFYDPAVLLIYPGDPLTPVQKETCTGMFLVMAKKWEPLKCPPREEWLNKM